MTGLWYCKRLKYSEPLQGGSELHTIGAFNRLSSLAGLPGQISTLEGRWIGDVPPGSQIPSWIDSLARLLERQTIEWAMLLSDPVWQRLPERLQTYSEMTLNAFHLLVYRTPIVIKYLSPRESWISRM